MKVSAVTLPVIAASVAEPADGSGEAVGFQSHRPMSSYTLRVALVWLRHRHAFFLFLIGG